MECNVILIFMPIHMNIFQFKISPLYHRFYCQTFYVIYDEDQSNSPLSCGITVELLNTL